MESCATASGGKSVTKGGLFAIGSAVFPSSKRRIVRFPAVFDGRMGFFSGGMGFAFGADTSLYELRQIRRCLARRLWQDVGSRARCESLLKVLSF